MLLQGEWRERMNQVLLQLDGVKIKDRSNQPRGEPESGYFRKSGEKGTVELTVGGAKNCSTLKRPPSDRPFRGNSF